MSGNAFTWLNDPANWRDQVGTPGIVTQLANHLEYAGAALGIAALIALPLGLVVGHTGRAAWLVSAVNGLRALPTVGLLILCYVVLAPHFHGRSSAVYFIPTTIVLVLLAIPPILANTYAGLQNVGDAVSDAALGMGMTGGQTLVRVKLPIALPLIMSGIRSAALQVIATATVAAYVGLGGLGRFVYDGLASHDFAEMTGGGILVALLALVVDLALALVTRYAVSRGVSGRFANRAGRRPADAVTALVEVAEVSAI